MELRELEKVNPMTVDFRGMPVVINPDAFTDGFFFAVAEQFRKRYADKIAEIATDVEAEKETKEPVSDTEALMALVDQAVERIRMLGEEIEGRKRTHAALLAGTSESPVVLSWELTKDGVPVPCTEEGFLTLKPKTLAELWEVVSTAALPKSQGIGTIPQNQTTNESTQSPSASPETQAEESPIM